MRFLIHMTIHPLGNLHQNISLSRAAQLLKNGFLYKKDVIFKKHY
jgi:hypothetical protein